MTDIVEAFKNLEIIVFRRPSGRIEIIKYHRECIPSHSLLGPSSLNNKRRKLVHSAIVKQLRQYYTLDSVSNTYSFEGLPDELLEQVLVHLRHAESLADSLVLHTSLRKKLTVRT